jgi:hypothetical protein
MRLSGREQVSHKTLSALIAELELYGYVEVERKGRGRGAVSYIYIRLTQAELPGEDTDDQMAFCADLLLQLLTTIYTPCKQFFLPAVK